MAADTLSGAADNYTEPIHGGLELESNPPYLMYTHGNDEVRFGAPCVLLYADNQFGCVARVRYLSKWICALYMSVALAHHVASQRMQRMPF